MTGLIPTKFWHIHIMIHTRAGFASPHTANNTHTHTHRPYKAAFVDYWRPLSHCLPYLKNMQRLECVYICMCIYMCNVSVNPFPHLVRVMSVRNGVPAQLTFHIRHFLSRWYFLGFVRSAPGPRLCFCCDMCVSGQVCAGVYRCVPQRWREILIHWSFNMWPRARRGSQRAAEHVGK